MASTLLLHETDRFILQFRAAVRGGLWRNYLDTESEEGARTTRANCESFHHFRGYEFRLIREKTIREELVD